VEVFQSATEGISEPQTTRSEDQIVDQELPNVSPLKEIPYTIFENGENLWETMESPLDGFNGFQDPFDTWNYM
jgi:hypothetical protein